MEHTPQIAQLIKQNRHYASSYGYWKRAAESLRTSNSSQASACQQRADEAEKLRKTIKDQLQALDPEGSKHRLKQSVYSNISHTRRTIAQLREKDDPVNKSRCHRQQQRLARLENQLAELNHLSYADHAERGSRPLADFHDLG